MEGRAQRLEVLDLRTVGGAEERLDLIRVSISRLGPGGYLELTCEDDEAESSFEDLASELPGLRWTALGPEGPPFRYALFAPAGDATQEILHFLHSEGRLLDERLDEVDELASELSLVAAAPAARSFEEALAHHVEIEERIFFPLVERHCRDPKPLSKLRAQHARLLELAGEVTRALDRQDSRRFISAMDSLQSALSGHHAIETSLMEAMAA